MDYVKKRFEDLPSRATPVMAADLNNMGAGIEYLVQGVDRLTDSVALKVNAADVYSRAEVDAAVSPKASSADVYTKAETFSRAETGTQITGAITASRPPLYGTGFPNGKIAAPVGTLYADEAVTNGASLWQKVTGTGNTGWAVVAGDTGRRNIAALLGSNFSTEVPAGGAFVERRGPLITANIAAKSLGSARYEMILPVIPGFNKSVPGIAGYGSTNLGEFIAAGSYGGVGHIQILGALSAGNTFTLQLQYFTNDPWPATLPGTN